MQVRPPVAGGRTYEQTIPNLVQLRRIRERDCKLL